MKMRGLNSSESLRSFRIKSQILNKITNFYDKQVVAFLSDPQLQVAHTENGRSVSNAQLDSLVSDIKKRLMLRPVDRLLDL